MKTSFHYPDEIKTVGLYYLKYSRNAWHSTWVTYYHPGDIHHELQSLKNRAEELRTPGSQFKIETREALWVKFKYSNVLIFQVNTVSDFYYSSALKSIKDGKNSRVFCNDRFNWSTNLNNLFTNLENNRFFLSNAERNYGTYSVQVNNNKNLYTAFFRLKNEKGKFNGIRYQLVLFVESAYFREKPKKVQNVKIATIVSKALEGEMVKKFRR